MYSVTGGLRKEKEENEKQGEEESIRSETDGEKG